MPQASLSNNPLAKYAPVIDSIAQRLLDSLGVEKGETVLLQYDNWDEPIVQSAVLKARELGVHLLFANRDLDSIGPKIARLSEDEIREFVAPVKEKVNQADRILIIRCSKNPLALDAIAPDKKKAFEDAYLNAHERRFEGKVRWLLTYFPTRFEAAQEMLPYDIYVDEVLPAFDQPWKRIHEAQALLIAKLDAGKTLRLIANPNDPDPGRHTDVSMSIEGMTFCNSTVARNYPGSEVYSAPQLHSVEGRIFGAGNYMYHGHGMMRDISLEIEKGKIVRALAAEGNETLQEILDTDQGSRYFGEVALGTNPGLTRRFFSSFLSEKVSGSFHMAIGRCYADPAYMGKPVSTNNGNTGDITKIHWDFTVMMQAKYGGGRVLLDDEVIQEDGIFLDPALSVLNPAR